MKATTYLILTAVFGLLMIFSGIGALWCGITAGIKLVTAHPIVAVGKFIWMGALIAVMWFSSRICTASMDKSGLVD